MFFKDVENRQRANVGGLFVVTHDEVECCRGLRETLSERAEVSFWSTASGFLDAKGNPKHEDGGKVTDTLRGLLSKLRTSNGQHPKATIFMGAEAVLESTAVARRLLLEVVRLSRRKGHLLVVISRGKEIHPELREIASLKHPLPSFEDTEKRVVAFMTSWENQGKEAQFIQGAKHAATMLVGLTATQQADALSLCLAEGEQQVSGHYHLSTDSLRRFKEAEVSKLGFLEVVTPEKKFDDIVGHDDLKDWVRMRKKAFSSDSPTGVPRGMMLVGPPGNGKSRIVEAVSQELGFPMLDFKLGSVFSKWLGETEAQMSHALEIAERMAPCVFFVDEADLALGGDSSDGGVTERVLGDLQKWMAVKKEPVFVVFTANFPQRLPAALTRKGRLDEIWFMDFPDPDEREGIFLYYLGGTSATDLDNLIKETSYWAAAEIEYVVGEGKLTAFCEDRPFSLDDVEQQIALTSPVSKTMKEDVDVMRSWAKEHARPTKNPLS